MCLACVKNQLYTISTISLAMKSMHWNPRRHSHMKVNFLHQRRCIGFPKTTKRRPKKEQFNTYKKAVHRQYILRYLFILEKWQLSAFRARNHHLEYFTLTAAITTLQYHCAKKRCETWLHYTWVHKLLNLRILKYVSKQKQVKIFSQELLFLI